MLQKSVTVCGIQDQQVPNLDGHVVQLMNDEALDGEAETAEHVRLCKHTPPDVRRPNAAVPRLA